MSVKFTKTALSWCLGKGTISLRGSKRRPWLEIKRVETEHTYLSYQLFSLRREHDGPFDDIRDVVPGESYYDSERIRFQGSGLDVAYGLLYPRDRKTISKQVLDLAGLQGLCALWMDCGRISLNRDGLIKGRFSNDDYGLIIDRIIDHQIRAMPLMVHGTIRGVRLKPDAMLSFARLIRPYAHFSMKAKLQLRKSPPGSGQTRSQPTDQLANALLRRVG